MKTGDIATEFFFISYNESLENSRQTNDAMDEKQTKIIGFIKISKTTFNISI